MFFRGGLDIVTTGGLGDRSILAPDCPPRKLRARIAGAQDRGRRVYLARGAGADAGPAFRADPDAQKFRQIYWVRNPGSAETLRKEDALRARLGTLLVADGALVSPQGWVYDRLALKSSLGATRRPPSFETPSAVEPAALGEISRILEEGIADRSARLQAGYLLEWLARSPDDAEAQKDLLSLLVRFRASWFGREKLFEAERARAQKAMDEASAACGELRRGRKEEALSRWSAARMACGACLSEGLPGFPSEAVPEKSLRWTCGRPSWLGVILQFPLAEERSEALLEKGLALAGVGRRAEAEASFREALDFDKRNFDARTSLGTLLAGSGRHAEALACFDDILSRGPDPDRRADALASRANSLDALGRTAEARRYRAEALRSATASWPWRSEVLAALAPRRD